MSASDPDDVVGLLRRLVSLPSVSWGDATPDPADPLRGETRMADFVADWMTALPGVVVAREDAAPGRPAVWGRLDAGRPATILLEAHLDTVAPDPADPDPFGAALRAGRVHGRGAADCKASLAVFLMALRDVAAAPGRARYNLLVAGAPDEEHGMAGSRLLARRLAGAIDFAICGEPTGLAPATRHKGVARWRLQARGMAAHSSEPARGVNAIGRAARLVVAIERYGAFLAAAAAPGDELGAATATVTMMRGGVASNIVPAECEIIIDRRLTPAESPDATAAEFEAFLRADKDLALPADAWEFAALRAFAPLSPLPSGEPLLADFRAALRAAGAPDAPIGMHCATDAPNYTAAGCPAVVWGPGDLAEAHTRQESVGVDEVCRALDALRAFLLAPEAT